jgi:hypothetical protein
MEGGFMTNHRLQLVLALAATFFLSPAPAHATQKFGPIQLSGNLQSENLVRHPDVSTYEFIMNRNTAHIQLQYNWLEAGKFYNKYEIPFVERSSLFLLYRGVYDSIYDTTPGFIEKNDIHGNVYGVDPTTGKGLSLFELAKLKGDAAGKPGFARNVLTISGLSHDERDILKFDNQLREFYIDLKMRPIPLTVRAGRQQVVWGETDNFRMLDRVNPLDLTWHFVWEIPPPAFGWDEIRRPLWMIKFLYDLGDIWKLSQNFLEWYWNPGDWYPAKQTFLPRPWGLRFLNPLTNPIDGAFIGGVCSSSRLQIKSGPNAGLHYCDTLMNNTKLFEKGDYARNAFENSQFGIRYHGLTPVGVEFTLNYFYQRWAGDDGTNYAPLRGLPNTTENRAKASELLSRGIFPAEAYHPYVHTLGASANYSDEQFTQAVFRAETIYDVGIPFFDLAKITTVDDPALPGITKKNMWKGMIAFDRPTWMKTLNKKSTIFLTGQFFWHYMVNNPGCDAATVQTSAAAKVASGSCIVGGLDLPSTVRNGKSPETATFRDKIRDWETIFTLAAFTFYRGGSIVPVTGIAVDPVNQFSMLPFWDVDYVFRDDLVLNLGQRYFVNPRGKDQIFSAWGLAGLNGGRSETSLRLTYQF